MDTEPEELQFLGVFGVYREAYKLLLSRRRIFSQIIAAFVLPLSAAYFAHIAISASLFANINRDMEALAGAGSISSASAAQSHLQSLMVSDWTAVILFNAAYFLFVLIFSLLSTSAVVYTVACAYTAKDVTFSELIVVVPKVWKRLMITFFWNLLIVSAYNTVVVFSIAVVVLLLVGAGYSTAGYTALAAIFVAYIAGLVYVSIVWQVASVVSVVEDCRGLAAMRKSRELLRGRLWLAVVVSVVPVVPLVVLEAGFRVLVVENTDSGVAAAAARLGYGAAVLSLLAGVMVVAQVVQAVVYLACKSYHHERIDKSSLADHLDVYLGSDYLPLKAKDVQFQQFHV